MPLSVGQVRLNLSCLICRIGSPEPDMFGFLVKQGEPERQKWGELNRPYFTFPRRGCKPRLREENRHGKHVGENQCISNSMTRLL